LIAGVAARNGSRASRGRQENSRSARSTTIAARSPAAAPICTALGAKIIIDYFIKQGGVEGYQLEPIYADAQSKPDVAINEAVRLVEHENVDMLLGFYSVGALRAGRPPRSSS
jgi:hypothetical protein